MVLGQQLNVLLGSTILYLEQAAFIQLEGDNTGFRFSLFLSYRSYSDVSPFFSCLADLFPELVSSLDTLLAPRVLGKSRRVYLHPSPPSLAS
jgi:hypothetical protein